MAGRFPRRRPREEKKESGVEPPHSKESWCVRGAEVQPAALWSAAARRRFLSLFAAGFNQRTERGDYLVTSCGSFSTFPAPSSARATIFAAAGTTASHSAKLSRVGFASTPLTSTRRTVPLSPVVPRTSSL